MGLKKSFYDWKPLFKPESSFTFLRYTENAKTILSALKHSGMNYFYFHLQN